MAKYIVTLSREEREMLSATYKTGVRAAKMVLHARALLLLDRGEHGPAKKWTVPEVSEALGMSIRSLDGIKQRFVEEGLEAAVGRHKRETPPCPIRFDGDFEARLIQLACSPQPEGHARWTIRLLRDQVIELQIVPSVSTMTICNILKKMNFSLTSANIGKSRQITMRHS